MNWVADLLLHLPAPAVYALVAAVVLAESVLLLCAFAPTLSTLLVSGFLARTGTVELALVIATATVAVLLGDLLAQRTGRRLGPRLRTGAVGRRVPSAVVDRTYRMLARRGGAAVFLSRFLPVVRTLAPHLAGSAGLRYRQLAPYSLAAALLWASAESGIGYAVGASYARLTSLAGPVLLAVAGVVVVVGALLVRRRSRRGVAPAVPEPPRWEAEDGRGRVAARCGER